MLLLPAAPGLAQVAGDPVAPQWNPTEILTWSPATDPDAAFNRCLVPLAARFINAGLNLNAHARVNEGRIMALVSFNSTPSASAQGARTTRYYAPTVWQYIDVLGFWGGSNHDNRRILAPPAHLVEAAHRNGVPVLGQVYLAPTVYGGVIDRVTEMVQSSGGIYPVADKMIEAARYYGFDGYFINQETEGGTSATASAMEGFLKYFKTKAPELHMTWYDSMINTGAISWRNALVSSNQMFFQDTTKVSDAMFLNFWWYGTSNLASSRTKALALGRDPYDIYAGIDTEGAGYTGYPTGSSTQLLDWTKAFPDDAGGNALAHVTSLGIYRPEWTFNYSSQTDLTDAITREIKYWSGHNSDPSNTAASASYPNWRGIAHYIPATSAITTKPFVTHFNVGQGTSFWADGTLRLSAPWTNLSTQDFLPTWKWNVVSSGTKLVAHLSFSDSYYGGSCLKVAGTLDATNDIKLYETSLAVGPSTVLQFIHKRTVAGISAMQVGLAFEDDLTKVIFLDVGAATTSWTSVQFPLAAYAGKKIALITLRFLGTTPISSYAVSLGRLAIYDSPGNLALPPANLVVLRKDSVEDNGISVRLRWTPSPSPVRFYNIFQRNPDLTRTWLGATANTVFFASVLRRQSTETTLQIEVEAVSPLYVASSVISTTVTMPAAPANKLSGAIIGTAAGSTATAQAYAFDGNTATWFEATGDSSSGWIGLDLGAANTKALTSIRYAPRVANAGRMNGGKIQASNDPAFATFVTLHSISYEPQYGVATTVSLDNSIAYRYVRYLTAGSGYCNVAELEFFGTESVPANKLAGTVIGTSGSFGGSGNTRDKVFDGSFLSYFDSPSVSDSWVGLDFGADNERVIQQVRYAPRATWASRMVGGKFQGANNADFSDAVTLYTVAVAPADAQWTMAMIAQGKAFRFVRYLCPANSSCNISELEFYGIPGPASPTGGVGGMSAGVAKLNWSATPGATRYTVRRATSLSGPWEVVAIEVAGTSFAEPGLSTQGSYYYIVSATTNTAEGPPSTPVLVRDQYLQWLLGKGLSAGAPGTAFNEDANKDGSANGREYGIPAGLQLTPVGALLKAEIRSDVTLSVSLQKSSDLLTWTSVPFSNASDQTGVTSGFIRWQGTDAAGGARQFYRVQLAR